MRRARFMAAAVAALSLLSSVIAMPSSAQASGLNGTALTDFSQITPASAIAFGTVQNTDPSQAPNLQALGSVIASKVNLPSMLQQALAGTGITSDSAQTLIAQVETGLGAVFNGELAFSLLPVTSVQNSRGRTVPQVHLIVDVGLRSPLSSIQIVAVESMLGSNIVKSVPSYRNVPIAEIDLRSLAGSANGSTTTTDAPVRGVLYSAITASAFVLASDLPSLKQAIDTVAGAAPSIATIADFQTTVGALPADRFFTSYLHVDTEQWRPFVTATKKPARSFPSTPGTGSVAFSLSAKTDGILESTSPAVLAGSLAATRTISPTATAEPSFLPANTLAYFGLSDPGAILRMAAGEAQVLSQAGSAGALTADSFAPAKIDAAIQQLNSRLGINLDDVVFSGLHGDASIAVLPVGSTDFGTSGPTTRVSLVVTLRVPNQATAEAQLAAIETALQAIPNSGFTSATFVQVPAGGNVLNMLAATPSGAGYTFYNGYLVLASALPADFAAVQQTSGTGSLAADPLYKAALAHFGTRPVGTVVYANLTRVRETVEQIAAASGADMSQYNQRVQPLLSSFTSIASVTYAGTNGGRAMFLGIGS